MPGLSKNNSIAKSIAFASISSGAAKVSAAKILCPEFAVQEQENKTQGLQEPQFFFRMWAFYA